jgi:anaerobic selenocysteine-containing dehydrogenase
MNEDTDSRRTRTYCALCISRGGAIATVEDGRFTRLEPDPAHPTGQALCAKDAPDRSWSTTLNG